MPTLYMLAWLVKIKIADRYAAIDYKLKSENIQQLQHSKSNITCFVFMSQDPRKADC